MNLLVLFVKKNKETQFPFSVESLEKKQKIWYNLTNFKGEIIWQYI